MSWAGYESQTDGRHTEIIMKISAKNSTRNKVVEMLFTRLNRGESMGGTTIRSVSPGIIFSYMMRSLAIFVLAFALLSLYAPAYASDDMTDQPDAPTNTKIFLPNVVIVDEQAASTEKEPEPEVKGPGTQEPVGPGSDNLTCDLSDYEKKVAEFMQSDPRQGRATMRCNPILARVARERAQDMGARGYFSHTNPDGEGPNYLVLKAGYELPSWYPADRTVNNLESIGAGYANPAEVWEAWMKSSKHRMHILAEVSFYASQTEYGIGFAEVPGSPFEQYWVVITAPAP